MTDADITEKLPASNPATTTILDQAASQRIRELLDEKTRQGARKRKRRGAAVAVCAASVVLAAGAAAAGGVPSAVSEAFTLRNSGVPDLTSEPQAKAAQLKVTGSGPENSELSVWTAPIHTGSCIAIIGSAEGAELEPGKPEIDGAACGQGGSAADQTPDGLSVIGGQWKSARTNRMYWRFGGSAEHAVRVELHTPGKPTRTVAINNEWFVGAVPQKDLSKPTTLIAYSASGEVVQKSQL